MSLSKVFILLDFLEEFAMKESVFQKELKDKIKNRFPDSIIMKQESRQGFPDLLILNGNKWVALECKCSAKAHHQPNQENYVKKLNDMSFASFIFPENEEEVLNEVFKTLES